MYIPSHSCRQLVCPSIGLTIWLHDVFVASVLVDHVVMACAPVLSGTI